MNHFGCLQTKNHHSSAKQCVIGHYDEQQLLTFTRNHAKNTFEYPREQMIKLGSEGFSFGKIYVKLIVKFPKVNAIIFRNMAPSSARQG